MKVFYFIFSLGSIGTFKHHKKNITEASKGLECGIGFDDYESFESGDVIQCLNLSLVKRTIV